MRRSPARVAVAPAEAATSTRWRHYIAACRSEQAGGRFFSASALRRQAAFARFPFLRIAPPRNRPLAESGRVLICVICPSRAQRGSQARRRTTDGYGDRGRGGSGRVSTLLSGRVQSPPRHSDTLLTGSPHGPGILCWLRTSAREGASQLPVPIAWVADGTSQPADASEG